MHNITDEIKNILTKAHICRLGLIDDNNISYIVPVNFVYSPDDNCIIFHSGSKGKKINLLKKYNKIAFEIDTYEGIIPAELPCSYSAKFQSVMGIASVEIIDNDINKKIEMLNLLMQKYTGKTFSFEEKNLLPVNIVKLSIQECTSRIH